MACSPCSAWSFSIIGGFMAPTLVGHPLGITGKVRPEGMAVPTVKLPERFAIADCISLDPIQEQV
jgi:hypothetical protein